MTQRQRVFLKLLFGAVLASTPCASRASWLSDITGVDVNLNRGSVNFGPPRLDRIPQMLQNLPKDTAQFFLNPAGGILASEIRRAKDDARRACSAMPPDVVQTLQPFFPPDLFPSVCWSVVANGSNLANWAIRDGGMAAITLEDVTVFRTSDDGHDPVLWAHELAHVLQYRRLGVESFAALYTVAWDSLEQEARNMDQFVAARLQAASQSSQYWRTLPGWTYAPVSAQQYSQAARTVINPVQCSGWRNDYPGPIVEVNNCPIEIYVKAIVFTEGNTGNEVTVPCLVNCIVPAHASVGLNPSNIAPRWAAVLSSGPYDVKTINISWPGDPTQSNVFFHY